MYRYIMLILNDLLLGLRLGVCLSSETRVLYLVPCSFDPTLLIKLNHDQIWISLIKIRVYFLHLKFDYLTTVQPHYYNHYCTDYTIST